MDMMRELFRDWDFPARDGGNRGYLRGFMVCFFLSTLWVSVCASACFGFWLICHSMMLGDVYSDFFSFGKDFE
jgi:hypothetical protein